MEDFALKRKSWNRHALVLIVILALVAVGFNSTQGLAQQGPTQDRQDTQRQPAKPETPIVASNTAFGQFPPSTLDERELERMLRGKDEDIDLALANWLIAADVPQFGDLPRDRYFKLLDGMTEQVRQDMDKMQTSGWKGADPKDPFSRCRMFCNAIIRLKFAYSDEFRQEQLAPTLFMNLHADANNTFLAGLLRTHRGTCVSMPLVYLVIGRRLNLPVHLVTIGRHYFIRWDEPACRLNIEPTIVEKVCVTPDDSVYLESEGLTRAQVRGSDLRNLTSREVVGNLFFTRSCFWATKGGNCESQRCRDLSRAHHLAPEDPAIAAAYQTVSNHYGIKPEHTSINIQIKNKKGDEK